MVRLNKISWVHGAVLYYKCIDSMISNDNKNDINHHHLSSANNIPII